MVLTRVKVACEAPWPADHQDHLAHESSTSLGLCHKWLLGTQFIEPWVVWVIFVLHSRLILIYISPDAIQNENCPSGKVR